MAAPERSEGASRQNERLKDMKAIVAALILMVALPLFAQDEAAEGRILVLREAKETQDTSAAVEVYLVDDILEVTVYALMYATRPKIYNVLVVGPGLGRMSPQERQTVYPKAEDRDIFFQTTDVDGGLIRFSKRTKKKKMEGTLTKELVRFRIPAEKIRPDGRYQLRLHLESMQSSGQTRRFRFDLKDLPDLILK